MAEQSRLANAGKTVWTDIQDRFVAWVKSLWQSDGIGRVMMLCGALLLVLKSLYLLAELYYNRTLILFGSTAGIAGTSIDNIALLGQNMASTGATLFFMGLILPRIYQRMRQSDAPRTQAIVEFVLYAAAAAALCYGSVFIAQKAAMQVIIASSSDKTAYNAYHAGLYQQAVLSGNVIHSGLFRNAANGPIPAHLTNKQRIGLTMLPFALVGSDNYIARIHSKGQGIARSYARERLYASRFHRDYERYIKAQDALRFIWHPYRRAMLEISRHTRLALVRARSVYGGIPLAAYHRYDEYKRQERDFETATLKPALQHKVPSVQHWLERYFGSPDDYAYDRTMRARLGFVPDPSTWCAGAQCPGPITHTRQQMKRLLKQRFKRNAHGIPFGLSRREFYHQAPIQQKMSRLIEQNAPRGMDANNYRAARSEIMRRMRRKTKAALKRIQANAPAELSGDITSGMSLKDFMALRYIEDDVRPTLPKMIRHQDLTLNEGQFFERIWRPAAEKKLAQFNSHYLPKNPQTMETSKWQRSRAQSLKAAYVIPLAMALSFLFLVMNTATLFSFLFFRPALRRYATVGIMVLVFALPPLVNAGTTAYSSMPAYTVPRPIAWIMTSSRLVQPLGSAVHWLAPDAWTRAYIPSNVLASRANHQTSPSGARH